MRVSANVTHIDSNEQDVLIARISAIITREDMDSENATFEISIDDYANTSSIHDTTEIEYPAQHDATLRNAILYYFSSKLDTVYCSVDLAAPIAFNFEFDY